jgi:uncharacterized delta-60 repeat protein
MTNSTMSAPHNVLLRRALAMALSTSLVSCAKHRSFGRFQPTRDAATDTVTRTDDALLPVLCLDGEPCDAASENARDRLDCLSDLDCSAGTPLCDQTAHTCRACDSDDDCFAGKENAEANPAAIQVRTTSSFVRLRQGTEAFLAVTLSHPSGFTGDVTVEVTGLPGGVAADAAVVPTGATTATLRIEAAASALTGGPREIVVRAAARNGAPIDGERKLELYVAGRAGTADFSYGTTGVATFDAPRLELQDRDIDARGRVVIATLYSSNPTERALIRFAQDGTLDQSFGANGVVRENEGTTSFVYDVLARADGIYALSNNFTDPTSVRFVRRYFEDGSVDPSFGIGGDSVIDADVRRLASWRGQLLAFNYDAQVFSFESAGATRLMPAAPEFLNDLMEDGNGRLIAASNLLSVPPTPVPLARFDEQTSTYIPYTGIVPGNGYVAVETDGIVPLADGNLLVALRIDVGTAIPVRLLRVTPAGSIDATYGDGGQVAISDEWGGLESIVVDSEGQTMIIGTNDRLDNELAHYLRRYSPSGVLDSSFGNGGEVTLPVGLKGEMHHEVDAGRVIICSVFDLPGGTPAPIGTPEVAAPLQQLRCARYWL